MNIAIIPGSHRTQGESRRISNVLNDILTKELNAKTTLLDLQELKLPMWDDGVWGKAERWQKIWSPVSQQLQKADGFVVVSPEWSGMVPPGLKNFFVLCDAHELAHKPGLIVAVSSGMGGAYPVAELRMSSYKNTRICWMPDHVIIRTVTNIWKNPSTNPQLDQEIRNRAVYHLKVLTAYANALKTVRASGIIDYKQFPYGQ